MAPYCNICSYRQPSPKPQRSVYHRHYSSREVRIMQGVEYSSNNHTYMCPSCMDTHIARPENGINVCLGTSQLHDVHRPRDPDVTCPPDILHIDWVTVSGGTIADLEDAFLYDFAKQTRPMRILISAGLNDLAQGVSVTDIIMRFIHLKETVDAQSRYHPSIKNELVIATLLLPPKFIWFPDYGPAPPSHPNLLNEVTELNRWIVYYNKLSGKSTPRFSRFGVREGHRN